MSDTTPERAALNDALKCLCTGCLIWRQAGEPKDGEHDCDVMRIDREWFEAHPGESEYIRPRITGEQPGGPGQLVLVRSIGPGLRARTALDPV